MCMVRKLLCIVVLIVVYALTSASVFADIWVYTEVELYSRQNGAQINPRQHPELFHTGWRLYPSPLMNTADWSDGLEMLFSDIISTVNCGANLYDSNFFGAAVSCAKAYDDISNLFSNNDYRWNSIGNTFVFNYPNSQAKAIKVRFRAYSDDDDFTMPAANPKQFFEFW